MDRPASRASIDSAASTISRASRGSMDTARSTAYTEVTQVIEAAPAEPQEELWSGWRLPFKNPATAPWDVTISQEEFEGFLAGFEANHPNDMWYIKAMPRDESSNITLVHFARFMAESPDYTIVIHKDQTGDEERICIMSIIWETIETLLSPTGDYISEDYAKRQVVFVSRQLLWVELPGLEELQYDEWLPKWSAWKNAISASTPDESDVEDLREELEEIL